MKLLKEVMNPLEFAELQNQQFEAHKNATLKEEYPEVHKGSKNIKHKPKKMKFWNYR